MIKIIVKNARLYEKLAGMGPIRSFFRFDVRHLNRLSGSLLYFEMLDEIKNFNGTSKTTRKERFKDIEAATLETLRKNYSGETVVNVHDLAVSDGITSVELHELLRSGELNTSITISDKYSTLGLAGNGIVKKIYDSDHRVQFSYFGKVYADKRLSWKYPISKVLGYIFQKGKADPRFSDKIYLLHPRALRLIEEKVLHFLEDDIFNSIAQDGYFHFVRSMNILNPIYFNREELLRALRSIHKMLAADGLLLVGRSDVETGINNATFYKRTPDGFLLLHHFNQGTEIKALFEEFHV